MKIGIVGLGLIGGSIFKDLINLGYDVVGVSNSQSGANIYKDYSVLKGCELVFVCSAMNKTLAILDELENYLSPQTVVTDVCSLKSFVCNKQRSYEFIPSHPMAGTEHKGFENSFEGLFRGAKWVITPYYHSERSEESLSVLKKVVEQLGAEVVTATPKEHDEAVALISHMPMVIAQAIFKTAESNELAMKIAASGFRDMTRLAMSNTEMANDMVMMNSENIQNAILKLYKSVGELTNSEYRRQIDEISVKRKEMFK